MLLVGLVKSKEQRFQRKLRQPNLIFVNFIGSHTLSSVPQRGGRGCAAPVGLHRAYISMSPFFPWRFLRSDWILSCISSLTAFHISVCKCLCRSLCGLKAMDTSCCWRRVPSLCLSETCCLLSFPLCLLSTVAHSPLTNKSIMGDRDIRA